MWACVFCMMWQVHLYPWHFPAFGSSSPERPARGEYRSSRTEHYSSHKPPVHLKLK